MVFNVGRVEFTFIFACTAGVEVVTYVGLIQFVTAQPVAVLALELLAVLRLHLAKVFSCNVFGVDACSISYNRVDLPVWTL